MKGNESIIIFLAIIGLPLCIWLLIVMPNASKCGSCGRPLRMHRQKTYHSVIGDKNVEICKTCYKCGVRFTHRETVHKAQGSHFPRVIIPVGKGFNYDRVWLYTALTRAVAQIEIVGNPKDLKDCIAQEGKAEKRTTCLSSYLKHIKH